jgi:dihydrolipoamide dehydrogenase
MAQQIEVKVPDIGDFKEVAVIEVMVKPGETVAVDTSLVMVESDKASMEIPSSHAGVVKEVRVKVDDKVSEGSTILVLETTGVATAPTPGPASQRPIPARRISNATCWCWAPVPAVIRPPSAPPISA